MPSGKLGRPGRWGPQGQQHGVAWINENFQLCPAQAGHSSTMVLGLKNYLTDLWTDLAMMDYPTHNIPGPLPATPVAAACKSLTKNTIRRGAALPLVFGAASVLLQLHRGQQVPGPEYLGRRHRCWLWTYQSCTEQMVMPSATTALTTSSRPLPGTWRPTARSARPLGSVPARPGRDPVRGRQLEAASLHCSFSNGLWTLVPVGVLKPVGV